MSELARKLKQAREAMYPVVTQKAVAEGLEVTAGAVTRWERGDNEPNAHTLARLAEWYQVSADWLLSLDEKAAGPRAAASISGRGKTAGPAVHLVPVLPARTLVRWQVDEAPLELLQTSVAYPARSAAAILVESDALHSSCPTGAYAVVSKDHIPQAGSIVLAVHGRAGEPVLRRLMKDGGDQLLVADDQRFPSFNVNSGVRIIGSVTEITMRRRLV